MKVINYIQWQTEFATGIDKIDEGRLQFIKLHNLLLDIITQDNCNDKILEFIYSLLYYAEHHLLNEELHYQHFEGIAEHKAHHKLFVNTISETMNEITKNDSLKGCEKLLVYLNNWFITHILQQDREVVDAIKMMQAKTK